MRFSHGKVDSMINSDNKFFTLSFVAGLPALIHTKPSRDDMKNKSEAKRKHQLCPLDLRSLSVGWDNYQMLQHVKLESNRKKNSMLKFAMTFAVRHRTPSLGLNDTIGNTASSLDSMTFLPSTADVGYVRHQCMELVKRIVVNHMPGLQHLQKQVLKHLPHRYAAQMAGKSDVVNLGVIQADPASNAGVNNIMERLQTMCPSVNGNMLRIPCNGDQSSIERMSNLKKAKVKEKTIEDQHGGLVETVQEFHKEGILMQVYISIFE